MKELLNSKKFWVTLLGTLATVLSENSDQQPVVTWAIVIGTAAFVVAQGIADQGKEAAKVHNATMDKIQSRPLMVYKPGGSMQPGTYWDGERYVAPDDPAWSVEAFEKVAKTEKETA